MNTIKRCFLLLTMILVFLAAAAGIWCLLSTLLAWIMDQPSQIAAAIIAFAGTVIAGIGAVVISQQRTKAREISEAHRPKKTELYSDFITQVIGIMRDHKGGKTPDTTAMKRLEDFFFNFTTSVMLWGSPRVLRCYGLFRRTGQQSNPAVILLMDDILQAMRKDLGLSNWGLERGDLIKMLLTDPETIDALVKKERIK